MNNNETTIKEKKPRRIGRKILKFFGILFLIILVAVVILTIRHYFKCKSDRKIFENAYGEYFTTSSGDRINYTFYDSKSDDVAIVLPGYGCSTAHYEFDAFADRLKDDYKIIIVDPLGVGLSDGTKRKRTVENYCEELHELMQYLDYDKYTIIGHSIAGLYSLYYANQYTDEVEAFIGIDASLPHQSDDAIWIAKPKNTRILYKIVRVAFVKTGIERLITELSFDEYMKQIPTLTKDDREKALALYCTASLTDTQMDEMNELPDNMDKCYDMKFPPQIPVLYVLAKSNVDSMSSWEQIHRDVVTNPNSKVTVIKGEHYLHFTNLDGLIEEIQKWKTNDIKQQEAA
ncbi:MULTISPECIES: alpha/beta fold hydrolase [Ruminococcus]|uniref:Pimeloyl-ACP methyl ester carboxylesterase n=1 Tax=Ruminococcus flavefaciens TaxID=1265 RepID=A0A1M7HDQ3_RUMFL|nr:MULTISPECIES: alpha/beta hydrolase [Ruminococcus]MCR4795398.1 alpha/beta hydrolase [Ruminococcus sp.]SHM26564.1 Pimeloyl-ACP methyl ester carboxylesterase [Ruminococcus flavefaciens]